MAFEGGLRKEERCGKKYDPKRKGMAHVINRRKKGDKWVDVPDFNHKCGLYKGHEGVCQCSCGFCFVEE